MISKEDCPITLTAHSKNAGGSKHFGILAFENVVGELGISI